MAQPIVELHSSTGVEYVNTPLEQYCDSLKAKYIPNKKALLIQIPQSILQSFNPEVARKRGYYAFPPTGLQYLYESMLERDLDVRILDLNFLLLKRVCEDESFDHSQWLTLLEDYLETFDPYIIGVSCMFDAGIQPLIQILEFLGRRDQSITIAGGVVSTYEWQNLIGRDLCHFVIKGEGENKLNCLFDHLTDENLGHAPTPGIYLKFQNDLQESQGEPDFVPVRSNLIKSYSLVEIENYYRYGSLNPFSRMAAIYNSPFAAIQMNRGCRAACTFCAVRDFNGKGVRARAPDEVLQEMDFLIHNRGIRHFEWLDDDLLFSKKDLHYLLESIIERQWGITWSANNGLIAASVDEYTMQLMRDSGCIGFKIGIETGNAEMLRKVRKPGTLPRFLSFAKILEGYPEVFVGGNMILGFPDETFSKDMDTYRFSLEVNLDWFPFTICQIIRGASAFSDFEDYFDAQMNSDGQLIKNFLPVRDSADGQMLAGTSVAKGLDVFRLDPNLVPDEDQIKEIWFTFNLVVNYINNKNLKPDGRVEKFISWVEMAQSAYPTNPYMSLFLSLAYIIDGKSAEADAHYQKAVAAHQTDYWLDRFVSFGLMDVLKDFPKNTSEVFHTMEMLRERTAPRNLGKTTTVPGQ